MFHETIPIRVPGSADYARLDTYFTDLSPEMPRQDRLPTVLVCPGGGYTFTSAREAEPIALRFLTMGFRAAVLWYSVAPAVFPTALLEVARSVAYIRTEGVRHGCDPEKVFTVGFSAGGHLAASYGDFWAEPFVAETVGVEKELLRPSGQVLCYPVITSGEFAHHDSILKLLGDSYEEKRAMMSLEDHVTKDTPPTFLWHTEADELVPVENSLRMAAALREKHIRFELHIYPDGGHGLALANDITAWDENGKIARVARWIEDAGAFLKTL